MYVCVCKGVRFSEAVEAARSWGAAPAELIEAFGFDDADSCGRCARRIAEISVMVRLELDKRRLDLAAA